MNHLVKADVFNSIGMDHCIFDWGCDPSQEKNTQISKPRKNKPIEQAQKHPVQPNVENNSCGLELLPPPPPPPPLKNPVVCPLCEFFYVREKI